MPTYKVSEKDRRAIAFTALGCAAIPIFFGLMSLFDGEPTPTVNLVLFAILTALFGSGALYCGWYWLHLRDGSITIDDRGLDFYEGGQHHRYLWNELTAIRLNGRSSSTLSLHRGEKRGIKSISIYEPYHEVLAKILEQAEPRGLLALPDGATLRIWLNRKAALVGVALCCVLTLASLALIFAPFEFVKIVGGLLALCFALVTVISAQTYTTEYKVHRQSISMKSMGKEKTIRFDRPVTYSEAGGNSAHVTIRLQQGDVKIDITSHLDGFYNLILWVGKQVEEQSISQPEQDKPAYEKAQRGRGITLALLVVMLGTLTGFSFFAGHKVTEPVRLADQDPVQVPGRVVHAAEDLIRYEYTAAALPYQQKDFVAVAEGVKVGDPVQVTYWRVNPHMSYTDKSFRLEKGRRLILGNLVSVGAAAILLALMVVRRKKRGEEPEKPGILESKT